MGVRAMVIWTMATLSLVFVGEHAVMPVPAGGRTETADGAAGRAPLFRGYFAKMNQSTGIVEKADRIPRIDVVKFVPPTAVLQSGKSSNMINESTAQIINQTVSLVPPQAFLSSDPPIQRFTDPINNDDARYQPAPWINPVNVPSNPYAPNPICFKPPIPRPNYADSMCWCPDPYTTASPKRNCLFY